MNTIAKNINLNTWPLARNLILKRKNYKNLKKNKANFVLKIPQKISRTVY